MKTCPVCEGRGVVAGVPEDPTYRDDEGEVDCPNCNGTGVIERARRNKDGCH